MLKKAALWSKKERFEKAVHSWLTSKDTSWNVAASQAVLTQQGKVVPVEVEIGEWREKLHVGKLGPLLNTRSVVSLIYLELKEKADGPIGGDVLAAIGHLAMKKGGVRLIVWGTKFVMEKARAQLLAMQEGGGPLSGYQEKEILVFLPNESCYGSRTHGYANVDRHVLILGPSTMKQCLGYVVSHLPWGPSLVDHLIQCAGLAMSSFHMRM